MDEHKLSADVRAGTVGHGGGGPAPQINLRDMLSETEKQAAALGEMLNELEGRLYGFRAEQAEAPGSAAIPDPTALATALRVSKALRGCYGAVESLLART